mmetsp:Transcript_401/g.787  ORF Transcript_401/g.787 Transcript_401/m.787 type:complete len:209 (-) Transcript_401:4133-4759(-)
MPRPSTSRTTAASSALPPSTRSASPTSSTVSSSRWCVPSPPRRRQLRRALRPSSIQSAPSSPPRSPPMASLLSPRWPSPPRRPTSLLTHPCSCPNRMRLPLGCTSLLPSPSPQRPTARARAMQSGGCSLCCPFSARIARACQMPRWPSRPRKGAPNAPSSTTSRSSRRRRLTLRCSSVLWPRSPTPTTLTAARRWAMGAAGCLPTECG